MHIEMNGSKEEITNTNPAKSNIIHAADELVVLPGIRSDMFLIPKYISSSEWIRSQRKSVYVYCSFIYLLFFSFLFSIRIGSYHLIIL